MKNKKMEKKEDNKEEEDCQFVGRRKEEIQPLMLHERIAPMQKPSLEESTSIELKPLSMHLKYIYLEEDETFSVIISLKLTEK